MAFVRTLLCFFLITNIVSAQDLPGQYSQASSRLLMTADVSTLSAADLKIMRNEIFARYGYIFKSADLKKHFEAQAWYKPLSADVTSQLTDTEKKNIELIRSWEDRIANTSDFYDFFQIFKKAVLNNDTEKILSLGCYDQCNEMSLTREDVENSFDIHGDEIRETLNADGMPRGQDNMRALPFGEKYEGIQYKSVQFRKSGCCWYVLGVFQAG
jgi:hypothetical protein